jgi:hypothetical protein
MHDPGPTIAGSDAASELLALEARHSQLQTLVSELLTTNQGLRFRIVALEGQLERAQRGLADAATWMGMIFP